LGTERALDIFSKLGNEADAGLMLNSLGVTLKALGRHDQARARLHEAITLHRRSANPRLEGHALAALGDLSLETGDTEQALRCYESSRAIRQRIGDRLGEGWMLLALARVPLDQGPSDRARLLSAQAAEIAAEFDDAELAAECRRIVATQTAGERNA
jgi:tetratricopeptide (TPR) repeat protein